MQQIWKDTAFTSSANTLPFTIQVDGETIYDGVLSKMPGKNEVSMNVNKLCESSLGLNFPEATGVTSHPEAYRVFSIVDSGGTTLETRDFIYDWSYEDFRPVLSRPVNGHIDSRMLLPYTMWRSAAGTVDVYTVEKEDWVDPGCYFEAPCAYDCWYDGPASCGGEGSCGSDGTCTTDGACTSDGICEYDSVPCVAYGGTGVPIYANTLEFPAGDPRSLTPGFVQIVNTDYTISGIYEFSASTVGDFYGERVENQHGSGQTKVYQGIALFPETYVGKATGTTTLYKIEHPDSIVDYDKITKVPFAELNLSLTSDIISYPSASTKHIIVETLSITGDTGNSIYSEDGTTSVGACGFQKILTDGIRLNVNQQYVETEINNNVLTIRKSAKDNCFNYSTSQNGVKIRFMQPGYVRYEFETYGQEASITDVYIEDTVEWFNSIPVVEPYYHKYQKLKYYKAYDEERNHLDKSITVHCKNGTVILRSWS